MNITLNQNTEPSIAFIVESNLDNVLFYTHLDSHAQNVGEQSVQLALQEAVMTLMRGGHEITGVVNVHTFRQLQTGDEVELFAGAEVLYHADPDYAEGGLYLIPLASLLHIDAVRHALPQDNNPGAMQA